jgi:hypothetical protein
MAAPYAAGLVARLLSAAAASQRTVVAFQVAQALRRSAHPVIATSAVEAGVGTPDLSLAWQWLADQHAMPTLAVDVGQVRGRGAIFLVQPPAGDARLPTSIPVGQPRRVAVTVRRLDASTPLTLRLKASAEWLHLPATVTTTDGAASFEASIDPTALLKPGAYLASIAVTTDDAALGTVATIPVTVVVPISARAMLVTDTLAVPVGGTTRFFIPADSGRGLQLDVVTRRPGAQVMAMLHEPFGMPFRDGAAAPAGFGDAAAHYDLSAEDAVAGVYELDLVAPPGTAEEAIVTVRRAPIRLDGLFAKDTLHVFATNVASSSVSLRLRAGLIGAERVIKVDQPNDMPLRLAIPVPAWATRMIVDARMPRTVWSRYTDFGVTIEERGGLQLEATPLNYAFGRSGVEVPPTARGDSLIVLLAPGFADPSGSHAWALELRVRFYVDKPFMLDEGGAPPRLLGVSAARDERFGITRWPVTGPAGFDPLLILVALEGDNHIWTRQLRLAVDGGVPK